MCNARVGRQFIFTHTFFFFLAHYQDVILTIFKYINLLKKDGVQPRIFEEVQSLASLAFRFKEKYPPSQYTSRLAGLMQHGYPSSYILSGPSLIREYDADLIKSNLDWIRPDNFRIMLASQTPPEGIEFTERETWYGTEYKVVDFDQKLIQVIQIRGRDKHVKVIVIVIGKFGGRRGFDLAWTQRFHSHQF